MSEHVQTRSNADFPRPHDRLPGTFRPVSTRQIREKVREGSRVLFPLSRFPEMCHAANGSKVDERFTRTRSGDSFYFGSFEKLLFSRAL